MHEHIYKTGLRSLIDDCPVLDAKAPATEPAPEWVEGEFELWKIIKTETLEKLRGLHRTIRYGNFVGSKVKLPTDHTKPMELDLLGEYEEGIFILELKVDKSAERNAFSELFAYSNYIAGMFALSGPKDIANVLVANMDAKITREAFLYDLLISDRNILVYKPVFPDDDLTHMRLRVHVPSDDDFRYLANRLLSHDAMSCAVVSFDDVKGWIDTEEAGSSVAKHTKENLTALSSYAAQLMEAERLHGFCFIRKRWREIPSYYYNTLVICALNPFWIADFERQESIVKQIDSKAQNTFFEIPEMGFLGRLLNIAKRTVDGGLPNNIESELETPLWSGMVKSSIETVFTENFGFRPTGILRKAYVSYLNSIYASKDGAEIEDVSTLKIEEVFNWFRAWEFMEMCGFVDGESSEEHIGDDDEAEDAEDGER